MPPLTSLVVLSLALLSSAPSPPGPPLRPPLDEGTPRWLWPALERGAAVRSPAGVDSPDDLLDDEEADGEAVPGGGAGVPGGAGDPSDDDDLLDDGLEESP